MSLPEPLDPDRTSQLPALDNGADPRRAEQAARRARGTLSAGRSLARRAVGKAVRTGLGPLGSRLHRIVVDVDQLRDRLDRIEASQVEAEVARSALESTRVTGEVLKGEVGEIARKLDVVGAAFAPTAGVEAAGARFAELREQVNALERRMRRLDSLLEQGALASPAVTDPGPDGSTAPAVAPTAPFLSELFNYVAFERRFRGDPQDVLRTQTERYADLLAQHGPVVDLGCGRGELLEVLTERGVECLGVEPDAGMVAEARDRGLRIEHTDAIAFLESAQPESLGAIFNAHVLEHVPVPIMLSIIELAVSRLAPGGIFVAETPNPASLVVLGESFILDPTHVRPIHPALMAFLCETAGFRDVRLEFFAPAAHHHLGEIDAHDGPPWLEQLNANTRKLNDVLFGPQDYAVIATTADG